jgi:hypothetical protein
MPVMPASHGVANSALYAWVVGQLGAGGALTALFASPYTVIWGHQDGPRPPYPYAILYWAAPLASLDGKAERQLIDNGDDTFTTSDEYDAQGTVRIELLSKSELDPSTGLDETLSLVSGLEASLRTMRQVEAFTAAGLAFVTSSALSIPVVSGFGFERRTRLDCVFRARVRVDVADVPVLEMDSLNDIETDADGSTISGIVGSI